MPSFHAFKTNEQVKKLNNKKICSEIYSAGSVKKIYLYLYTTLGLNKETEEYQGIC